MTVRWSRARRRFVAAIAVALPAVALAQDPNASIVQRTAREWLAYTDKLDAKAAWEQAAPKFRDALPLDTWSQALQRERASRGSVERRTVVHTEFRRGDIGGGPTGDYALVVFRTAFKNVEGQESVTLEREPDNAWRVVGYVIR